MSTEERTDEPDALATGDLLGGVVGDRCPSCASPLASDQRYCVTCGERRGKARFSLDALSAKPAAAEPPPPPTRPRLSAGTTLAAGVATLLLAMGVGVLVGRSSNSGSSRAAAPFQVVTVGNGGGAQATDGGGAGPSGAAAAHKLGKIKPVVVHLTPKVLKAANNAAGKVLGSTNNLVQNPTVQVGQACSGGAGCQNGKFTGNFFPGG